MKRIVPWLTALCLPLLIGAGIVDLGSQPAGAAPAPSGWDPDVVYAGLNQTSAWENDGFEALPDFEREGPDVTPDMGRNNRRPKDS